MHHPVAAPRSRTHRFTDPIIRRVYMDADHLSDPDRDPVHVDHLGNGGVLFTGHVGLVAADIVPYVLARLPYPGCVRLWLDVYGLTQVHADDVIRDWRTALRPYLHLPVQRDQLPAQARWPR